jgi:hypothetical protein
MTGALTLNTTTLDNQIIINNTATNRYSSIKFFNGTKNGYIGIGCTLTAGTYQNNLFIEANNSIIFATNGTNSSTAIPTMILNTSGNLGINVASPEQKIDVNGSILLRTAVATTGGTGGIFFRNGYTTTSVYNCSIMTYDHNADTFCDGISINGYDGVSFCTGANTRQERMRINVNGNIGIQTTNPNNILQVGDGARLRISNGSNDYSLIGTKDVDDNTNTRIVISGNTRSGYAGHIQYLSTAGDHIFYTSVVNERMRINNSGNVGIGNPTPLGLLSLGRPDIASDGTLVISKNGSGNRNFKMGVLISALVILVVILLEILGLQINSRLIGILVMSGLGLLILHLN